MQGNIHIESELGKGTVVTTVLIHRIADISDNDKEPEEEALLREEDFKGKRINQKNGR